MIMKYLVGLIIVIVFIDLSCLSSSNDCVCTKEIVESKVYILNQAGTLIDSLATWIANKRTGVVYRSDSAAFYFGSSFANGEYIVFSDIEKHYLSSRPETLVFHASNQIYNISQQYIFRIDNCQCHIQKVFGPDTIIAH